MNQTPGLNGFQTEIVSTVWQFADRQWRYLSRDCS